MNHIDRVLLRFDSVHPQLARIITEIKDLQQRLAQTSLSEDEQFKNSRLLEIQEGLENAMDAFEQVISDNH